MPNIWPVSWRAFFNFENMERIFELPHGINCRILRIGTGLFDIRFKKFEDGIFHQVNFCFTRKEFDDSYTGVTGHLLYYYYKLYKL